MSKVLHQGGSCILAAKVFVMSRLLLKSLEDKVRPPQRVIIHVNYLRILFVELSEDCSIAPGSIDFPPEPTAPPYRSAVEND